MSKKNRTKFKRVFKEKNFTIVDNEIIKRADLSWKARAILIYVLSLPDDWNINLNEVMRHSTDGEASFRSGWKELTDAGYVERNPVRDKDNKRITHWETIIYESVDASTKKPHSENLHVGNLDVENLHVENRKLQRTNSTKNLDIQITNNTNNIINEDFKKVHNFYENNLGPMSPFNRDDVLDWIEDLSADLVIEALKRTVENQKRYSYAKGIMQNWVDSNVKTLDDVKALDVSFNYKKGKPEQKERNYNAWKTQ